MGKIALVGHSQIPQQFSFPGAHIIIFRAPGAKASSFFEDTRMNQVPEWEHDLTILWIGSNDIASNIDPEILINHNKEICHTIEEDCQCVVYVCQVEPSLHPRNLSHEQYKIIQCGINNSV